MHLFYPTFVLFALTTFVAMRLGALRYRAVARQEVDPRFYKLYRGDGEPDQVRQHSRHLINLMEVPVLFYATTLIAFVTGQTGVLVLALCWAYVVLRLVHSWVHLTRNKVLVRFKVFIASWAVLVVLMVTVLLGIIRHN